MRPSHNTTSAVDSAAGFHRWNSPVPYLFGGLAVMFGLITLALLVLACSLCGGGRSSADTAGDRPRDDRKPGPEMETEMVMEMEPKFVVIMAGDHNPTCLAKPVAVVSASDEV